MSRLMSTRFSERSVASNARRANAPFVVPPSLESPTAPTLDASAPVATEGAPLTPSAPSSGMDTDTERLSSTKLAKPASHGNKTEPSLHLSTGRVMKKQSSLIFLLT